MISKKELIQLIDDTKSALIVCHHNPDGDTLGAAFGLYDYLSKFCQCEVYCDDKVPHLYSFIPGCENLLDTIPEILPTIVFAIDCGSLDRLGKAKKLKGQAKLVNIDHHGTNEHFGDINYVKDNSSSTCEIIYSLLVEGRGDITSTTADCLYTGIITDTGRFGYDYTTAYSLKAAANLMELGADFNAIHKHIFRTKRLAKVKLQAAVLSTLEIFDGKIGIIYSDEQMYKNTGAIKSDNEGIVNNVVEIEEIMVAIIISEIEKGSVKVSMRGKGDAHVNLIAQKFGGGGHAKAAGCSLNCNIAEAKIILLTEIRESLVL